MKHILITGGNGFVGRNLIFEILLHYPKSNITIIDNFSSSHPNQKIRGAGIKYLKMNTWDIKRLKHKNFDTVFHFGEYARISTSFEDREQVMNSNIYGTQKVIEMCLHWKAKLIYSASSSIFGNNGEDENLSPYAWSKAKNVELIKNYNKWFDLQYEICYFYNVYGPGHISRGRMATVIGIWEEQCKMGYPLTVRSPGTQKRAFTHVEDIVSGVVKASEQNANHEWFLRSPKTYTLVEAAELFSEDIEYLPSVKGDRKSAVSIPNDTEKRLDWKCYNTLEHYAKMFKIQNYE